MPQYDHITITDTTPYFPDTDAAERRHLLEGLFARVTAFLPVFTQAVLVTDGSGSGPYNSNIELYCWCEDTTKGIRVERYSNGAVDTTLLDTADYGTDHSIRQSQADIHARQYAPPPQSPTA